MKQQLKKNQGFTIIEVMIVLAIAGLILLIVFLAVPALQRNARNTSIKNDASAIAAAVTEYESNNSGTTPTGVAATQIGAATASQQGPSVYLVAAANGVGALAKVQGSTTVKTITAVPTATTINSSTVEMFVGQTCNSGASGRAVAVYYGIDTGSGTEGWGCIDS